MAEVRFQTNRNYYENRVSEHSYLEITLISYKLIYKT